MKYLKSNWKTLGIGFLVGILVCVGTYKICKNYKRGLWKDPEKKHARIMKKLTRKLSLTEDQQTKVAVIIKDKHAKMMDIHKDMYERFDTVRDTTRDDMRAVLTAEQLPKFEELIKKWEKRRSKYRRKWKK